MKSISTSAVFTMLVAVALCLTAVQTAFAHVVVQPSEVATASYHTFTVSVPNEKDVPTTGLKLDIPEGITSVTPTVKEGWVITRSTEGEGEAKTVTSISWKGGKIDEGLRDEFTFSAKTPDQSGEIRWKAYQTYQDGSIVSWDQDESKVGHSHEDSSSKGPFSVTRVSADVDSEHDHSHDDEEVSATSGDWALYVSVVSLAVGFGALFVALKRK